MKEQPFHHALKIIEEVCTGCSHCMRVCPTGAIRINDGKAKLISNRCIDCGKCYSACPSHAIIVEQDDFNKVFDYQHRIALVPSVLFGQFPEDIPTREIYSILLELGFTNVFEVEHSVDILEKEMINYMENIAEEKPVISSFCPAVVRLIQVKFPSLTENIMLLKTPVDIAATYYKQRLLDMGVDEKNIGIFYITPCPAKIAAMKSPVGEKQSAITGVINMNFIYNKIFRKVKEHGKRESCIVPGLKLISHKGVKWSLTHGEADCVSGRSLAIDEIHNVINFLEKIENEELDDIDFLELRSCDESCAGGVLTAGNRFLTVERLRKRAEKFKKRQNDPEFRKDGLGISDYTDFIKSNIPLEPVKPRSMEVLDNDIATAIRKIQKVNKIMKKLPLVDCGVCGAPSCQALAEDIVREKAKITQCVFISKGDKSQEDLRNLANVWGWDKIRKIK